MAKLGKRQLSLTLKAPLPGIPTALDAYQLDLSADGYKLVYTYDNQGAGRCPSCCTTSAGSRSNSRT